MVVFQSSNYLTCIRICFQVLEVRQEDVFDLVDVRTGIILCAEQSRHWIAKVNGLRIPPCGKIDLGDVECGHHVMVFMNQVVAVEHIEARPWSKICHDFNFLCFLLVMGSTAMEK